mmetsp:Transcript_3464/g.6497  ORF Transcript_3464/g.6497 Transcript_3464/m.6497 type:complete len:165 (-) Transcript_3464:1246-1740(-)
MAFVSGGLLSGIPRASQVTICSLAAGSRFVSPVLLHRSRCRAINNVRMSSELISVQECHRRKHEGSTWKHVDVRTPEEFAAGHAPDSVNIPFRLSSAAGMVPNPSFLGTVKERFSENDSLMLSCASGRRSAAAAAELLQAGFTNLADVEGGWGAWTADQALPKI